VSQFLGHDREPADARYLTHPTVANHGGECMAAKKTSKRQSTRRASSRVIFRTHVDPKDGGTPWYQAGPLFLQSSTFSETDPFKETMSSALAQRVTQAKRQSARALQLLERARNQE
jgi:hypothetical protein